MESSITESVYVLGSAGVGIETESELRAAVMMVYPNLYELCDVMAEGRVSTWTSTTTVNLRRR